MTRAYKAVYRAWRPNADGLPDCLTNVFGRYLDRIVPAYVPYRPNAPRRRMRAPGGRIVRRVMR